MAPLRDIDGVLAFHKNVKFRQWLGTYVELLKQNYSRGALSTRSCFSFCNEVSKLSNLTLLFRVKQDVKNQILAMFPNMKLRQKVSKNQDNTMNSKNQLAYRLILSVTGIPELVGLFLVWCYH